MRASWKRGVVGAAGLLVGAACEPQDLPGTQVGRYDIEGTLVENTCGSTALPAVDPLVFEVELRDQGGVGIWIMEPPGVTGELSAGGRFRFVYGSEYTAIQPGATMPALEEPLDYLRLDPPAGAPSPGCSLAIRETITGRVMRRLGEAEAGASMDAQVGDAGASGVDLWADNTIDITPGPGSDCSPALASHGGVFLELPCEAQYELSGSLMP